MDDKLYIFIILFLTIIILFFGGHKNINDVVYESNHFIFKNNLFLLKEKFKNIYNLIKNSNNKINDLTTYNLQIEKLIPNLQKNIIVIIEPKTFLKKEEIQLDNYNSHIMIFYNFLDINNNLELLIEKNGSEGYFFYIENNQLSLHTIHDIYNNSINKAILYIAVFKKPFWFN